MFVVILLCKLIIIDMMASSLVHRTDVLVGRKHVYTNEII